MTRSLIFGSIFAVAALAGCAAGTQNTDQGSSSQTATSSGNGQTCNADPVQTAIGQQATPELLETYRQQAGAKMARILRPRDVITMEYNPQRLNLRVDEQDTVISVNCS